MKKQRRKYKLDDHRVLSLHETTTTTIDAKKEKLFLIKHNQNIDIFFEGRRTVWTEHATFNIFIVNHCYIIPNILEIIAFHSPTATDDHIYVPLPSILRELNHDDLKIRIQSQREKLLSISRSCYDQEIYQKCANELIVQSLLQRIRISSNNSTLSRSHSVTVNLSYESNSNISTCDKPAELIPVEIGLRKIASRMGRNIASPLPLSSFNNAVRRQITSPVQVPAAHMSSISEYDKHFPDTMAATESSIDERNPTDKKDYDAMVSLSSDPIPAVSCESRPPLPTHTGGLPNRPPLLVDPQPPPPRTHLLLPPLHTDIAHAASSTSLFEPDSVDVSCALKIKESYLPPCAFLNPVMALPPSSSMKREVRVRVRVSLPVLREAPSLNRLPPSMSQSYHEKSCLAVEKAADQQTVHFSWGPGRMDVPKRRRPPRMLAQ